MQKICVIGGNRCVGKRSVKRLQAVGRKVAAVKCGSTQPPVGVELLVVDRNAEADLTAALGSRTCDVVDEQVCYTPVQAAIAARAFAGHTRRYVMTSPIEVNARATAALQAVPPGTPVPEEIVHPATSLVAVDLSWHDDVYHWLPGAAAEVLTTEPSPTV
ncbi:hypothetical protein ACFCZT_30410 [Streptomyces sp. NPDC056230]|uniref:hypothetical protein n=1 Tax=unclassified Streptomyces TaxID=2593676 RepID=UPI0035E215A8